MSGAVGIALPPDRCIRGTLETGSWKLARSDSSCLAAVGRLLDSGNPLIAACAVHSHLAGDPLPASHDDSFYHSCVMASGAHAILRGQILHRNL